MALVRIEESFQTQLEWQEIEDRLYSVAEWLGFQLIYEDPDYVFMRGNSRTLMPSVLMMATTLTVAIRRDEEADSHVCMELVVVPGAGSSISPGEVELLRQELAEVARWMEGLEQPAVDRVQQVAWGHRRDIRAGLATEASIWLAGIVTAWYYGWLMGIVVFGSIYGLTWIWNSRVRRHYPECPLDRPGPHVGLAAKLRERYHLARASEIRDLQGRPVFEDIEA